MSSDNSSDIVNINVLDSHFFLNSFCNILCIFRAITMCDHYDLIFISLCLLCGHVYDLVQRLLSATLFANYFQTSIIIHNNDWFNLYHCSKHSTCLGHTSASMQMIQIIHCYIMANMKLILFCPLCSLLNRCPVFLLF